MFGIYGYCCHHWHSLILIGGIATSIWLVYRKRDEFDI